MKKGKLLSVLAILFWLLLIVSLFMLEFLFPGQEVFVIITIVFLVFVGVFNSWFIYTCLKSKKKIEELQQQYVDTLKPDSPLRFCPSDNELMENHLLQKTNTQVVDVTNEEEKEITKEDSEEMEIEQ